MIIAADFDGTLSLGNWPEVGPANHELINYLIERQNAGDKLILWTCRADDALEKAVKWCKEQGLNFDAINDNLPETKERYGNNSRKISCDFYIDDRAVSVGNYKKELALSSKVFDFDFVKYQLISFADNLIKCS